MDKKEALKIILKSAKEYDNNLCNNNIMFVCRDKKQRLFTFEVTFLPRNFLHLTGIKIINQNINSSIKFYRACLGNKLDIKDFKYSEDGTTIMKLNILPQIVKLHKIAKMFGEYNNSKPYLFTEKIAGNINTCVGFVKNKEFYYPNTALKEDIRNLISNDRKATVMYIFMKKVDELLYSNITYVSNDYNLGKLLKNNKIISRIDKIKLSVEPENKNEKLDRFIKEFHKCFLNNSNNE